MPRPIDREWAEGLVGLRMQVASHWWDGYRGDTTLNPGVIHSIDFNDGAHRYFQLELDGERGQLYPMRYDAVLKYADENHEGHRGFHLPREAPSDPARDRVRAPRQRGAPRRLNNDDASSSDEDEDEESADDDDASNTSETASMTEESEEEDEEEGGGDPATYRLTDKRKWHHVHGKGVTARARAKKRRIDPIPFTGPSSENEGSEEFDVDISDEELAELVDGDGNLRWARVFEWLLPRFGDDNDSFFEFLAARMRNYMVHIINTKAFIPRFYDPADELYITGDHVARFFGCHMARMLSGFPSIDDTWSTREPIGAVGSAKECMPKDAYQDIYRCMHFSDDWDEEEGAEWDRVYPDPKYEPSPDVARHRRKFEHIENGFNKRWKDCVVFGKWVTADESRVAGWYNSVITIGPEPKPIRTGATIHSLCVTMGALASYKLHCRVYGGKTDEDLNKKHANTANTQKWINLYDELLEDFKGRGHCVTMDSAYMGDIMAQICRDVWLINACGTSQSNRTGADVAAVKKAMKIGTYESEIWQHSTLNLVYAMWSDNNIVKTLSNFHSPEILAAGDGLLRKRRVDGQREQHRTEVTCPVQNRAYSETFHLIDKGNGSEASYDMGGASRLHNWSPKLTMRFFNMNFNNTHVVYELLSSRLGGDRRKVKMGDGVKELAHTLMQRGEPMRRYRAEHPQFTRDLTSVFDTGSGRKVRSDAKGVVSTAPEQPPRPQKTLRRVRKKQERTPWRTHQSMAFHTRGRCSYKDCPGIAAGEAKGVKRAREYKTYMHCEECSAAAGRTVWFCNDVKSGVPCLCHMAYHSKKIRK